YLLGFVTKPNFNGISEEESEESGSDMSDVDDSPKSNPAEDAQVDSDAVDYDESDDDLKPPSGPTIKTPTKALTLPPRPRSCRLYARSTTARCERSASVLRELSARP
ncbi:hypothetical protein F442_22020, partial [Phytophthora nicotianae P10297]